MVDSSQSLGEALMHHETGEGIGAMTGWMKEWVPKMFGAHAVGEGASEMAELMEWVGDPLAPINEAIMDEVRAIVDRMHAEQPLPSLIVRILAGRAGILKPLPPDIAAGISQRDWASPGSG